MFPQNYGKYNRISGKNKPKVKVPNENTWEESQTTGKNLPKKE